MLTTGRVVSFEVIGLPQSKGSTRAFVPKGWTHPILTSTNRNLKAWELLVKSQAQTVAREGLFLGAVAIAVTFWMPRPKRLRRARVCHHLTAPDLDKLARAVNDALTGVIYRDDSQVVDLHAFKRYTDGADPARACIIIGDAEPPAFTTPNLFSLSEEALTYGTTTFA